MPLYARYGINVKQDAHCAADVFKMLMQNPTQPQNDRRITDVTVTRCDTVLQSLSLFDLNFAGLYNYNRNCNSDKSLTQASSAAAAAGNRSHFQKTSKVSSLSPRKCSYTKLSIKYAS